MVLAQALYTEDETEKPDVRNVLVSLEDVTKVFPLGKTQVMALKRVSIKIHAGDFMAVMGPSGSGKTTLLNLIGCLDQPSSGRIKIEGDTVGDLSADELADLRARKLGLIFQTFNLIPVLTVGENVEYPLLLRGTSMSKQERRSKVREVLVNLGIDSLVDRRPPELSGGECQRAAIARALITAPKIVLADEPTSNLDSKTGNLILSLMKRLHEKRDVTFIFSTHDASLASLANRVVNLCDGEVVSDSRSMN